MSIPINSVVSVQIDRLTQFPSRAGFGVPLIIDENVVQGEGVIDTFVSLEEIIDAGFSTTDQAYLSAKALLSQNPTVENFKVARKEAAGIATTQIDTVTVDTLTPSIAYEVTVGGNTVSYNSLPAIAKEITVTVDTVTDTLLYQVTLGGVNFDFTSGVGATDQEIVDGLIALIDADPAYDSVGVTSSTFTVTAAVAGTDYTVANSAELSHIVDITNQIADTIETIIDAIVLEDFSLLNVTAAKTTPTTFTLTAVVPGTPFTPTVSAEMSSVNTIPNTPAEVEETMPEAIIRIQNTDPNWYFLLITSRDRTHILDAASTIEAMTKLFLFESDDADTKDLAATGDTTSIGASLEALNYDRTAMMWTKTTNLETYPMTALVGSMAPRTPGSATWRFKNLSGTAADDELTSTEVATIQTKNVNVYVTVGGIAISMEGIASSGEFIDIMRGTDKLQARIQENVYGALAQAPKIPYTNQGGDILGNQIRAALTESELEGLLASASSVVVVPNVADIPPAKRALREFGDITFTSTYAGAVHKVTIKGSISV